MSPVAPPDGAAARVASVVGEVVRETVRAAGATGVVLLDDGSPEAGLCAAWCAAALGDDAVLRLPTPAEDRVRRLVETAGRPFTGSRYELEEAHRFLARLEAASRNALVANPINKTALLLGGAVPPEPLLPLGDLYASQVQALAGGWSGPEEVRRLADEAGGVDALDQALVALLEERRLERDDRSETPSAVRTALLRALHSSRFARQRCGLIPKLTWRTIGIDLLP
ncbi:MAG TPA: hypothetical protein VKZ58_10490 [Longimicrobiales bacterium]|nr:hypothetical protein [Longimicrobiales bacterium]